MSPPPSNRPVDVSVLVVNFNSGSFLERFIRSLNACEAGGSVRFETIVVDCASPIDQTPWLDAVSNLGATVRRLEANVGFAGGLMAALEHARGETLLLCNADLYVVEPLLGTLHRQLLDNPNWGALAPRAFLDPDCHFTIPDFHMVTRSEVLREWASEFSGRLAVRIARRRARSRDAYWRAEEPTHHDNLHGACFAMRRSTLTELGGFDLEYPLYYEDTDLFRRIARSGADLVSTPHARVVHLIHRSAATEWTVAMEKHASGRARFLRRHVGRITARMDQLVRRFTARNRAERRFGIESTALPVTPQPPAVAWGRDEDDVIIECAFDPDFLEAAGHRTRGHSYRMSHRAWDSLAPGTYHLRALTDRATRELGRWTVVRAPVEDMALPREL